MKAPFAALAVLLAASVTAQTSSTPPVAPGAGTARVSRPSPGAANRSALSAKKVLPDPDLLDGSKYEPEKRPLYGMLSEIEMGEQEGGRQDKVSPNSGPAGGSPAQPQQQSGGGAPTPSSAPQAQQPPSGGSAQPLPLGPQAAAQGMQAQSLQVPAGAQSAGADGPQGAKNMQIGDATLQIQTVPQTPDTVGAQQPSNAQQYERPSPPGQQSNNRNQGVEKGKVIPKGL